MREEPKGGGRKQEKRRDSLSSRQVCGLFLSVDVKTQTTMPSSSQGAMSSAFWVGLWKRARQRDKRRKKRESRQDRRWSREGQNKTDSLSRVPSLLQCCRVCVLGLRLRLLWFVLALVSVAMGTLKSRTSLSSLVVEEAVSMQH